METAGQCFLLIIRARAPVCFICVYQDCVKILSVFTHPGARDSVSFLCENKEGRAYVSLILCAWKRENKRRNEVISRYILEDTQVSRRARNSSARQYSRISRKLRITSLSINRC